MSRVKGHTLGLLSLSYQEQVFWSTVSNGTVATNEDEAVELTMYRQRNSGAAASTGAESPPGAQGPPGPQGGPGVQGAQGEETLTQDQLDHVEKGEGPHLKEVLTFAL